MPQTVTCQDIDGTEHTVDVSSLCWRPSAYAVIVKDGCVLAIPAFGGYSLPGGALELGESISTALEREVAEETGLTVRVTRQLGFESNFFILPGISHKGNNIQSILLFCAAEYAGGELIAEEFAEDQKDFGGMPEWLPIVGLPGIRPAGADWRKYVEGYENTRD